MKDRLDREIEEGQYAMVLTTQWKSNAIGVMFVKIDRVTNNRVYIKRPFELLGQIQIEETWTSPNKILLIKEPTFVEGLQHSIAKSINEFMRMNPHSTDIETNVEELTQDTMQRLNE